MLEINGKEFSDEEVLAEYKKRKSEYLKWRRKKAAEFLRNKKRDKFYHCVIAPEEGGEDDYYLHLNKDIIARVRALKKEIANNPELKTDEDRADEFSDRIDEIGKDIAVDMPMPGEFVYTNIDLDDYIYLYRFDIHLFDWEGKRNGQRVFASTELTDEEYIELLAHLIYDPECSFNHLAYCGPKLKAIYNKVSEDLHHMDFGLMDYFCYEHDYAVLMTELRADANKLLKQLEKKGETYPNFKFLNDPVVSMIVANQERHKEQLEQ